MAPEDPHTLAFQDVNPGHMPVVPKRHSCDLLDVPDDDLQQVMRTVQRVEPAHDQAMAPDGMNLIQANRPAAFESVFHSRVRIIARSESDGQVPISRHGRATARRLRKMDAILADAMRGQQGAKHESWTLGQFACTAKCCLVLGLVLGVPSRPPRSCALLACGAPRPAERASRPADAARQMEMDADHCLREAGLGPRVQPRVGLLSVELEPWSELTSRAA